MALTWYEQGEEKGIEKGQLLAQRRMLRRLVEKRFGALSPEIIARIDTWTAEQLDAAILAVLDAQSLKDLGLAE